MDHRELPRMRAGIIGAGRLGRVLGDALVGAGIELVAASSRSATGRADAATRLGIELVDRPAAVAAAADLVFVCVPDSAIAQVALSCAETLGVAAPGTRRWFVHTSGCVGLEALDPLARLGHGVLALHPLQTVPAGASAADLLGAAAAITAPDEIARALGHGLARALGMSPFDLLPEDRARYHAAATIAANGTTTVVAAALELARGAGMGDAAAIRAFVGLARTALDHLEAEGAAAALTGPVSRGDAGTIRAHLAAIEHAAPHLQGLYRELAVITATHAAAADRIDAGQRGELDAVLA